MHIDYLIVGTDLSDSAGIAARWAEGVKEDLGAQIVLVHVVELSVKNWFKSSAEMFESDSSDLKEVARKNLEAWYKDQTGSAPDIVRLKLGGVIDKFKETCDEYEGSKMMVMASSARSGFEKMLLGSNIQQVATDPAAPLIIVHPETEQLQRQRPVIVGTDFSENADKAIVRAIKMANSLSAPLIIVHANTVPPVMVFAGGDLSMGVYESKATQWANEKMADLEARHANSLARIEYETVMSTDAPSDALVNLAIEKESSLIVVGHSGESELMQNVLGSVAQRTLNKMPCTLLIEPHA